MRVALAGLLATTCALVAPKVAAADGAGAAALYESAQSLMAQGRYAEACPRLAESQRLEPLLPKLAFLAVCHEREGKVATAWGEYLDVAAQARAAGLPTRESKARALAAALEPRLPKARIVVTDPAGDESIACDGVPLAAGALVIPLDPGVHEITAKAERRRTWSSSVTIEREPAEVQIVVPRLEDAAAPAGGVKSDPIPPAHVAQPRPSVGPSTVPPPAAKAPRATGFFVAGGVTGVVGLTGIALGIGYGVDAFAKKSASDKACVGGCDPSGVAFMNAARSSSYVSTGALAVGAAGAGAAAILLGIGVSRAKRVNASIGLGGANLDGTW